MKFFHSKRIFSFLFIISAFSTYSEDYSKKSSRDEWDGDSYAKNSISQEASAHDFLLPHDFRGDEKILDIGCGDGKITAQIAEKVPEGYVVGVDISPSMVRHAIQRHLHQELKNLDFQVKDAAELDFKEEFDLITSFTVMQWVLDQKDALKCFEQGLKSGGRVWIQIPAGLPPQMQTALNRVLDKDKWAPYFVNFQPSWRFYDLREYRELVVQAHLRPIQLGVERKDETFPTREKFQRFIGQWFPYLRALDQSLKEEFLTDLVDCYLEEMPLDEEGRVHFIVDRIEVEAEKRPSPHLN